MPSGLKRFQRAESLHFITFRCFDRLPLLETPGARETTEAGQTLVLSHPSRKRRSLDGAQSIEREPKVKNLTGPPANGDWK